MSKKSRRVAKARRALLTLSLVLVVAFAAVGGTVAWLTDRTADVVNVFTTSKIDIDLTESATEFQMIPGAAITKDPVVTVYEGSEACWVFVKIEKSDDYDEYLNTYVVDNANWTSLDGVEGVYYKEFTEKVGTTTELNVLAGAKVTVKDGVTQKMMIAVDEGEKTPTLTFTAYAVQRAGSATAAEAWAKTTSDTNKYYTGAQTTGTDTSDETTGNEGTGA